MTILILIYLIIVLLWSISVILFYALFSIFFLLLIFSLLWQLSFYRSRVLTLFEILELLILKCFHIMLFSCSVMTDFGSPWTAACQASLFFTISRNLLKLMSTELVILFNQYTESFYYWSFLQISWLLQKWQIWRRKEALSFSQRFLHVHSFIMHFFFKQALLGATKNLGISNYSLIL